MKTGLVTPECLALGIQRQADPLSFLTSLPNLFGELQTSEADSVSKQQHGAGRTHLQSQHLGSRGKRNSVRLRSGLHSERQVSWGYREAASKRFKTKTWWKGWSQGVPWSLLT